MRKFRYIGEDSSYFTTNRIYDEFTISVPWITPSADTFCVIDDRGIIGIYYYGNLLVDATAEYRDSIINGILL